MTDLPLTLNQTTTETELTFDAAAQELDQLLLQLTLDKQEVPQKQTDAIALAKEETSDIKPEPITANQAVKHTDQLTPDTRKSDGLEQAQKNLQKAANAYQKASDALQLAMDQLEEARNEQSDAKTNLETRTLDYSLAIQTVNDLANQPMVTESERYMASQNLALAKSAYNAAKNAHLYQISLSQTAYYAVVQAQATYETTQLTYDLANTSNLDSQSNPRNDDQLSEPSSDNIDFLLNFLRQNPSQKNTSTPYSDPKTPQLFDSNLPFERRPAIERPLTDEHFVQSDSTHSGHISWSFTDSNPKKTEHITHDKKRI